MAIKDNRKAESPKPKTEAPESEAKSHKPTFGEAAEKPEKTEPAGDPATDKKSPDEHKTLSEESKPNLQAWVDEQAFQPNPDEFQKNIHNPTTENLTASPYAQPKTIDPMTGQVHYAGDKAVLQGGIDKSAEEPE